jgi:hypothetical protein
MLYQMNSIDAIAFINRISIPNNYLGVFMCIIHVHVHVHVSLINFKLKIACKQIYLLLIIGDTITEKTEYYFLIIFYYIRCIFNLIHFKFLL